MANISLQTAQKLLAFLSVDSVNELLAALNNAQPSGPATFGAITVTTITGSGAAQIAGNLDINGVAGGAASNTEITKTLTALADNTTGTLFTITVPNIIVGATIRVTVMGMLGDGDSTDSKIYMIAVSRIAGAAAKAVAGTAIGTGATAGATGNATVTVAVPAVSGGITAVNTFAITGKVARSAGTSANHIIVAKVEVLNASAGGVTVA